MMKRSVFVVCIALVGLGCSCDGNAKNATSGSPKGGPSRSAPRLPPLDLTKPPNLALHVLHAWRSKDTPTLVRLSLPNERAVTRRQLRPGHAVYRQFFETKGWRWKSVAAWDGNTIEVRYKGSRIARVKYGQVDPRTIAMIQLVRQGQHWFFDDVAQEYQRAFDRLSLQPVQR